ncbi:MAG: hypothetical protein AB7R55_03710 [Gemmatimonadales bacterium]
MIRTSLGDFILFGREEPGGRLYLRHPNDGRNVWLAYDVEPDGRVSPPKLVFGGRDEGGWRGLPTA